MQAKDFQNLGSVTSDAAAVCPDKIALVMRDGEALTYAELDKRANQVANMLAAAGVANGDRIAVLGKNSASYIELMFGTAKAGAALVPINWRLAPPEISFILSDSTPKILFVDDAMLDLVASDASSQIIVIRDGYEKLLASSPAMVPNTVVDHADIAMLVYTSGTTGHPKAAMLHHGSFVRHCGLDAPGIAKEVAMFSDDVFIVAHPLFHIGSIEPVMRTMFNRGTVVLHSEFDAGAILEDIARYQATTIGLVPTALQMVLRHPDCAKTDTTSLDRIFYGASPIPQGLLLEALNRFSCGFIQAYGMTECGGACVMLGQDDHLDPSSPRLRSAGRPILGHQIRILDEEANDLPTGEIGEIAIHGSGVMTGYWNQPEATAATIDAEGWLRSGDAGSLDENGYVTIHDRVSDMIISGGENIYPIEVESAVYSHPHVCEVAVIGVPDDRWGESVKAVVVAEPGCIIDEADVISWVRQRIAGYKAPKSVDVVSELPKSAAGKIMRRAVKEKYWAHPKSIDGN